MNKFKQSVWCAGILYLAIFAFMMIANFLTPLIADDYSYHFSFLTGRRITGIFQIFPSLISHANNMNGRLVAHFGYSFLNCCQRHFSMWSIHLFLFLRFLYCTKSARLHLTERKITTFFSYFRSAPFGFFSPHLGRSIYGLTVPATTFGQVQ